MERFQVTQSWASGKRLLTCFVWLSAMAGVAYAHDSWLIPDEAVLAAGQAVDLSFTSGVIFPDAQAGPQPDRQVVSRFRQAGKDHSLLLPRNTAKDLRLRLVPRTAGIAAAWVSLKPFEVDFGDDIAQVYFDEINASAEQRALWARAGQDRHWYERFVKHAKTFVRFGSDAARPEDWATPVGAVYEIVPLADPTRLRVGDSFAVRVLKRGNPLAGLEMAAVYNRELRGGFVTTDKRGEARVVLDRAGWWLLRATELRASDASGKNWESDWVSLTVYVNPN